MFCTDCGSELAEHMSFCTTCGADVRDRHDDAIEPAPASTGPPSEAPPGPMPPVAAAALPPPPPPMGGESATSFLFTGEPAPPAPAGRGRLGAWLHTRRFQLLSRLLLALALIGAGILVGWFVASDRSLVESDLDRAVPEQAVEDESDGVSVSMPDLRGLTTSQAEQVLADAGVPASRVEVVDQPAAGTSGVVIGQQPIYGQAVTGTVTITGSTAAKVPAIQGRSAQAVLDELDEFGAEVRSVSVYVPGAKVGSVVRIKPAPGTLLPVAVTVTIAAEPGEVALSEIESEEGGCSTEDDQMNGTEYIGLISCSAYDEPEASVWLINRAAQRLTARIGIPDSSGTGSDRARLVIRGDGRVLGSFDVSYGRTQDIDVNVSGVLRLSVEYSSSAEDGSAVGLGNATLLGDETKLAPLESDQ